MDNNGLSKLPSPPLPLKRRLRGNTTKPSYEELEVSFAESESVGSEYEGEEAMESESDENEAMEPESEEEEEGKRSTFLQLKIDQAGDGTNNSLKTLSSSDICYVKESRQFRELVSAKDVYLSYNSERYLAAGKRIKYKPSVAVSTNPKTKKLKKPRKGNRTGRTADDCLPEKLSSNFSISAEIARLRLEEGPSVSSGKHQEEVEELLDNMTRDFPRWQYILRENFNIVLFGFGSKEPILQRFKSFLNDEFMVVDINGYFPKLNAKNVLLGFWEALDDFTDEALPTSGHNILAMADDMHRILSSVDHPSIYCVIHGLDKLALDQPKLFAALCKLSQVRYVHLIASVDHMNTGLGMGHGSIVDLNIFWINCTTFMKYDEELAWNKDELTHLQEDESTKSSLDQVLKSLTANAKKAFRILVTLQLDSMKASGQSSHKTFPGVPFTELSRRCREGFIAHGEMQLRALLIEFLDHKLVRYAGKGKKIDNLLIVDIETGILEEFDRS